MLGCLPGALSTFGIILEATPGIQIIDGREPGVTFQEGEAYRLRFGSTDQPVELVAYCLGNINNEPYFELDARSLPMVTHYNLGELCKISVTEGRTTRYPKGCFVGLTISGKPVFVVEGRLYTEEYPKELYP